MIPRHGQPPDPSLLSLATMCLIALGLAALATILIRTRPPSRWSRIRRSLLHSLLRRA